MIETDLTDQHPAPPKQIIPVVLGSGSPRRRELLSGLGLAFDVRVADIDESAQPGEQGIPYVVRLAREKARAVRAALPTDDHLPLVIAADTIVQAGVSPDGALLGKPRTTDHAKRMLAQLSGVTHRVHTGVAVAWRGSEHAAVATTSVRFHTMSEAEIDWYVATGESMDKAGAYGIQAHGALFVAGIEGSYFNVVGLPVDLLYRLVQEAGAPWQQLQRSEPLPPR